MKIAHLCLSNFYADGFSYQENELVACHVAQGHDVVVIASTESVASDGRLEYLPPRTYFGADGCRVIRLPYRKWIPPFFARKIRAHPGLLRILGEERPDLIVFHSLCGWELLNASAYARRTCGVRLVADSHEDRYNSGRSFLSKFLLHRVYYKAIIKLALPEIRKVLCLSLEVINFVIENYGVPRGKIEFFPLGARIIDDADYERLRAKCRAKFHVRDGQVIFLQSGKFDRAKRLGDSVKAFLALPSSAATFFIAGSLTGPERDELLPLIESDSRIRLLGWCNRDEMTELMCGADVYVQPGSQSASMQLSLGARCAVILDYVPSHVPFLDGNGWFTRDGRGLDLAMREAVDYPEMTKAKMSRSGEIARELLDYRRLAERLVAIQ